MTGAFVSRRRAEEFDALLSAPARTRDGDRSELLDIVDELRAVPSVAARPEFVADLRSQLVVEAARLARPAVDDEVRLRLTPRQRQGARERRIATALGGFAIVAASGSMAMASQSALPGDVLYPVKRAMENAQTNLQSDDAAKAQTLIDHAETRLREAEQLTAGGADATTVAETLQDFSEQSNQATDLALDDYAATGDEDSIGDLRTFASDSMGELDALGDVVPDDARAALITAAQSVLQADQAAFQVCPTCGDGGVTELPDFASAPASAPVALSIDLLTYQVTGQSVPVSPDFLKAVQEQADRTEPAEPGQDGQSTDDPTTVVPDPTNELPTTDAQDEVTDPLNQLGNQIKHELERDHSHDLDPVIDTIDSVVSGVSGLVDSIVVVD